MGITKKASWLWGVILLSITIMTPAAVGAPAEDILSHFQFYITAEEEYNSNIDLSPNRLKRDDFITTISPGIRFSTTPKSPVTGQFRQTPTAEERYGADLDFRAGFVFYGQEEDNNFTSLNGTLNAWYGFTKNLTFRVRDYLIRSDEIREADFSAAALPGQNLIGRTNRREPYYRNVFEPSLEYRFGRENIAAVNYRNNIYRIKSRISEDSTENYFNPRIVYWLNIRHGVSFEYGLTLGNFQRSPDLEGHMAMGRYTYRFNPRTSVFGEYTQLWRNFDSPSTDYLVYRPTLGIDHTFSPTLNARAQAGYYVADPRRGSSVDGPFFDLLVTQRAQRTTYTVSFQGGYTEDFFTAENQGFTQYYRTTGSVTHQLLQRMSVGLYGSYEWIKNPGTEDGFRTPKDQIWALGGNASYQILRWLSLSLDLSHRENHSNIADRDYSEYRGVLRMTAIY
jgi:hypothetical protein